MADLFRENLELLRRRWPRLAESLLSEKDQTNPTSGIRCMAVPSRLSGQPSLRLVWTRKQLTVHSLYDPVGEARRWAQGQDLRGVRYVGLFGLGLGYHVTELLRAWPELERVVVIEPSWAVFRSACSTVDLRPVMGSERVDLVVMSDGFEGGSGAVAGETERELLERLRPLFHPGGLGAVRFLEFGPYPHVFQRHHQLLRFVCARLGRAVRIEENTVLLFSQVWPENIFANLADTVTCPGVVNLFGRFKGRAAIVISAGPSLNKNLHLLHRTKGRAVLLCVGTALRPVLREGIIPDLVVTLDGAEANYRHFAGLSTSEIPLVFIPTAHYRILQEHHGFKFVAAGGDPLIEWICRLTEPKGSLRFGGSVAHAAFDLALCMGCEPVILVGQDLAYTGGVTHARGTVYEGRTAQEENGKFYVEDVYGDRVLTDHVLDAFRLWFERAIPTIAQGRLVIDATEGGAKIDGTVIMPLARALREYCIEQFPVAESIHSAARAPVPIAETGPRVLAALNEVVRHLARLAKAGRKGLNLARSLDLEYQRKSPDPATVRRLLRRMEAVDRDLQVVETATLLNIILQPLLLTVTKGPLSKVKEGETEQEFGRRVATRSALLYEGVARAAEKMQEHVAKARDALAARIQVR